MRIGDEHGGAVRQHRFPEGGRKDHARLYMHMRVRKSRRDGESADIDLRVAEQPFAHRDDLAVRDQDIGGVHAARAAVRDKSALQTYPRHILPPISGFRR